MGRYFNSKKEEADSLKLISVWFLNKHRYFAAGFKSGVITWTNSWIEEKSRISIEVNTYEVEKYVRLIYSQTSRETNKKEDIDYKVILSSTPCYFSGIRYWFICPCFTNGKYCGRRVGILYLSGKYFACRFCHNLTYTSRNESRSMRNYSLFSSLGLSFKIEKLESKIKRRKYAGKPTRLQRKINSLRKKEIPLELDFYRKVLNK